MAMNSSELSSFIILPDSVRSSFPNRNTEHRWKITPPLIIYTKIICAKKNVNYLFPILFKVIPHIATISRKVYVVGWIVLLGE